MRDYQKDYRKAIQYAQRAHQIQNYDGFPYEKHLQDVEDILISFGFGKYSKIVIAGWLHDIIEDTSNSYNDIKIHFGYEVAEIVFCVTDELGRNRKERKLKTYPKIKMNKDAIILKLADRIANVQNNVDKGDTTKVEMYMEEHEELKKEINNEDFVDNTINEMWEYLENLYDTSYTPPPVKEKTKK